MSFPHHLPDGAPGLSSLWGQVVSRSFSVRVLALLLAATPMALSSPYEGPPVSAPVTQIDGFVFRQLADQRLPPANLCSDAVFVRRVFLDVIGTVPTATEAEAFIADTDPDKRGQLIETLLQRDEFADYWSMKWGDLLRVKSEFPINLWPNAVQAYHRWIRVSLRDNLPYDRFARALLTSSGSNFRDAPVNFYRAMPGNEPATIARTVALTFMGTRTEAWTPEQRANLAAFFSQIGFKSTAEWKEEIVFFDASKAANAPAPSVFPDGKPAGVAPGQDPREAFADWLISPQNPWFARNAVNRIWSWLLGRGIVHEPDDFRADNPPANPALLAWLEEEFIRSRFDLKHVYRLILNSQTYQLSSLPRTDDPAGEVHFAHYPLRRLDAEVLIDAICQITGTREKYSSPIPEPFTYIPEDQRSISLADGSITSSFLEMFGRSTRDTGLESERANRPSATQRLHLLNSTHIKRKIEQGPLLKPLLRPGKKPPQAAVRDLYLAILSRHPTEAELEAVKNYADTAPVTRAEVLVDLAWALFNSAEFLYRH